MLMVVGPLMMSGSAILIELPPPLVAVVYFVALGHYGARMMSRLLRAVERSYRLATPRQRPAVDGPRRSADGPQAGGHRRTPPSQ